MHTCLAKNQRAAARAFPYGLEQRARAVDERGERQCDAGGAQHGRTGFHKAAVAGGCSMRTIHGAAAAMITASAVRADILAAQQKRNALFSRAWSLLPWA